MFLPSAYTNLSLEIAILVTKSGIDSTWAILADSLNVFVSKTRKLLEVCSLTMSRELSLSKTPWRIFDSASSSSRSRWFKDVNEAYSPMSHSARVPFEHNDIKTPSLFLANMTILALCISPVSLLLESTPGVLRLLIVLNCRPVWRLYTKMVLPHATKAFCVASQITVSTFWFNAVGVFFEIIYLAGLEAFSVLASYFLLSVDSRLVLPLLPAESTETIRFSLLLAILFNL